MSVIDNIIAIAAPHDCLGCGTEGGLLCLACSKKLWPPVSRCYRCQEPTLKFATCDDCGQKSSLQSVRAACQYRGEAKRLIWKLKFDGAQAAATQMTDIMLAEASLTASDLVMAVPTATSRIRRRGYDQAELLARAMAYYSPARQLSCLRRTGQSEQIGAGREQRLQQLANAFRVMHPQRITGRRIILIDDVVTTGATLEAAAEALLSAGAARVEALVFAQA